MDIRLARPADLPTLREIERDAGQRFHQIGMAQIADDEPLPIDELARYQHAGTAWVATDDAGAPVGYLLAEPVDGNLHIEQVSVLGRAAGHGVGRGLIERAAAYAAARGMPALTLTTFAHVPWNAPYYRRLGFRVLGEDEITPGLAGIRRQEIGHGLDRWPRVCMRRDL